MLPLFAILGLHYLWGIVLFCSRPRVPRLSSTAYRRLLFVPELGARSRCCFFLFSFIFALNANMDYVQRFIAGGGASGLRSIPEPSGCSSGFGLPARRVDAGTCSLRVGRPVLVRSAYNDRSQAPDFIVRPWAFAATLLSAVSRGDRDALLPRVWTAFPLLGWVAWSRSSSC